MAEVKNSFIKSKMNKDLDARLLPNGEYREGINIQVSRSEGADVGALENVLGNDILLDFTALTGVTALQSIGMYTNETSNNIYIFLTDFTDTNIETITAGAVAPNTQRNFNAASLNYYEGANNFICVYNTISREATILIKGAFLNFSTNNPILSVNLLEDLLFWTDNRNQPRRINIEFANNDPAITSPTYYVNEDQISVASYNPHEAINLYYLNSNVYNTNGGQGTVTTTQAAPGVTITLTAGSLVGVNPNKLIGAVVTGTNITANSKIVSYAGSLLTLDTATTVAVTAGTVLTFNENLSKDVYVTSMLDVISSNLPNDNNINPDYNPNYSGDPDYLEDKFVRFSYRFKFIDGEVSIMSPFTQAAFIPKQDGYFLGEVPALTPVATPSEIGNTTDEQSAYRSTVVEFMENKVNQIILNIPLPTNGEKLHADYKVDGIEILYKESDALSVKIVDVIPWDGDQGFGRMPNPSSPGSFQNRNISSVDYSYQGVKPYKTLPESNLVRVYDKVPVRALTQEIIGNRIVYGNFQNKHTPPNGLEFNVGIFNKYNFNIGSVGQPTAKPEWTTSIVEYPMHTVKQNRNYQIGIVLSDRYGRSSTTLLSSTKSQGSSTDGDDITTTFQGGTIYHPYAKNPGVTTPSLNKVHEWPGDSIKILFNQAIGFNGPVAGSSPNLENFWPGLYNGNATSEDYNPLGWYSYKVVVKQNEQEYYNVYLPGILNGYPGAPASPPDPLNTINFITLFGDNIDKVPADVTGVGPDQKQYRSGEQLYGRVTPKSSAGTPSPAFNTQFYPETLSDTSIAIANQDAMFNTVVDYKDVYQTATNPPVSRVNQSLVSNPIGSNPQPIATTTAYNFLLGVYETAPVESVIDIYWETSTSGLISELNNAINEETGGIVGFTTNQGGTKWIYNQYEDITTGNFDAVSGWTLPSINSTYTPGAAQPYAIVPFFPYYGGGGSPETNGVVNTTMTLNSVIDGIGRDRTSEFQLNRLAGSVSGQPQDEYAISVNSNFYYGANADVDETYTFTFTVTDIINENLQTTLTAFGSLSNVAPSFTTCPVSLNNTPGVELVYTYLGFNGSADSSRNKEDLTYEVVSQTPESPALTIENDANGNGALKDATKLLNGSMTVTVSITDAAGATASCTTSLNGSVGYRTLPLNDDFYTSGSKSINGSPLIINKASESSGFYWTSSLSTNINGDSVPGANASPTPYPVNRTPVGGLTLPATLSATGEDTAVVASACAGRSWVNTNRTAASSVLNDFLATNNRIAVLGDKAYEGSLTFGQPVGITTGTAYLIVDFEVSLLSGVSVQDAPGMIWPSYLQYRAAGTSTWEDVTDIEGAPVVFGQTQVNDWVVSSDASGPFNDTGVIDDRGKSISTVVNGDYDIFNSAEAYVKNVPAGFVNSIQPIKAVCRQLVVVGMCQAYRDQTTFNPVSDAPDKIGDYRLTIRYPGGRNKIADIPFYTDGGVNPAMSVGYCPIAPYDNYVNAQATQQVKLQFGDFYNPFQLGFRQNEISYAYRVAQQGFVDLSDAEVTNPVNVVYAREWSFKYVSRFYLDSRLTQAWEPGTVGNRDYNGQNQDFYYSFMSNENNLANAIDGNDYSNVSRESFLSYDAGANWNEQDRKWVGKFTQLGIKIKGTCVPLQYLNDQTGTAQGLPNGATFGGGEPFAIMPNFNDGNQRMWIQSGNAPTTVIGIQTLNFIFEGTTSSARNRAVTDSQSFASQLLDNFDPNGSNPINSGTVNWWRQLTGGENPEYHYMTGISFNGGGNQSFLTWNQVGDLCTIVITNCTLNTPIARRPANYYIDNPNA